jgi:serine/threonine protein kinase
MRPGKIIKERYQILQTLGRGGSGITYRAKDLQTGNEVALKEMSLNRLREWKDLDLLEREAQVLSYLDHPAIPQYLDHFEIDSADNHYFYLVQELAKGRSLFELIERGWRVTESEAREIALQILDVLTYLHSQSPPILHRDIKPHNIIHSQDGQISLVDFGSVRHAYWNRHNQGITVVGTLGYMAPEQDRGFAYPASDLYGLGATLLFLLTQRSPAELPQKRLKIDFRSHLQITPEFAGWLGKMLEPMLDDRFHSAREALKALQSPTIDPNAVILPPRQPVGSQIELWQTPEKLLIEIPPPSLPGFRGMGGNLNTPALILLVLVIIGLGISLIQITRHLPFFVFCILAFCLYFLILSRNFNLFNLLFRLGGKTALEFDLENFYLRWSIWGMRRYLKGSIGNIARVQIISKDRTKVKLSSILFRQTPKLRDSECYEYVVPTTKCAIMMKPGLNGQKIYEFGQFISAREREWLVEEITNFIDRRK